MTRSTRKNTRLAASLAAALLLSALVLPAQAFASKSIGISSPSFDFVVDAGGTGKGELFVLNEGTEPVKALVYVADQKVDSTGTVTYVMPNRDNIAADPGPATWLQLSLPQETKTLGNLPYVELQPKAKMKVGFEFGVPAGTEPGDHQAILFFETFESVKGQKGATTRVAARIGSRIKLRVKGDFVEKLDVAPFKVGSFVIGDKVPYSFMITNGGNLDERTTTGLVLLNGNEEEVAKADGGTDLPVYARTNRAVQGEIKAKGVGLGSYTVRLKTSYTKQGATQPEDIVKERSVFIVPMWAVITAAGLAACLLILVVALIVRAMRRRRRAREAAIADAAVAAAAAAAAPAAQAAPVESSEQQAG